MRVSPTPSSAARRLLSTRWRRAAAAIEQRNSPAAGHIQWSPDTELPPGRRLRMR